MTNTTPYHQFRESIAIKLIDADLYDQEWFKSQERRLSLYWRAGETVDSAFETVKAFAAALSSKELKPTDSRICLGVEFI
jgi:hypothetical protein